MKKLLAVGAVALVVGVGVWCWWPGGRRLSPGAAAARASARGEAARAKTFVASALREPYHLPMCRWAAKVRDENLVGYDTAADAETDGFRPCKVCRPDSNTNGR